MPRRSSRACWTPSRHASTRALQHLSTSAPEHMSRPHVVTSSELQSLRDLELVTRTTVEGLRQGLHRSPFHGFSAEFSQYRHYRPGDDLKYVDWKAFARTDRIYTRQFRETTNLSALFVLD